MSASGEPAAEGELVMTNLGRWGMPVIRYKTGDRVKLEGGECVCGRSYSRLAGGVIGRIDDVLIVRGINVFPSSIENIVRRFSSVGEFAADVYREKTLDELVLRIEVNEADPTRVADDVTKQIHHGLGLRVKVEPVPFGSLPRFDLKARRFKDHRDDA